jgi:hypothetical protein
VCGAGGAGISAPPARTATFRPAEQPGLVRSAALGATSRTKGETGRMRGRGLATSGSLAGMCSSTAHEASWRALNLLASASLGRERQIFTLRRVSATIDSPPRLRARPPSGRSSRSQVAFSRLWLCLRCRLQSSCTRIPTPSQQNCFHSGGIIPTLSGNWDWAGSRLEVAEWPIGTEVPMRRL